MNGQSAAARTGPPDVPAFVVVAGMLIVAGGLVAAVNSPAPFEHGSWLAAYLVLVGGVSQLLLGAGQVLLGASGRSARLARVQLWSWNVGTTAVAVGVLSELEAVVLAGSAVVLVALGAFAAGGGRSGPRVWVRVYRFAIGALAISVLVGCVLATATA